MPERYIVAIDLGTSAARAVLFDLSAKPLRVVRHPYPLLSPRPGWSEQDPEEIVKAVIRCLQEITGQVARKDEIACVTFSSQMYSILALDQTGRAVTHSITWNDRRSAKIAETLRDREGFRELVSSTGCPISEIFPLYKILWLRQNLAGYSNLKFVSIKDYVIASLTGQFIADWSTASASGLFRINTMEWDEDVLSFVGLEQFANLPEVASPRHVIHHWVSQGADLNILDGTPLVLGGGDGPLASLGIGAVRPGSIAVNVGTSAALRVTVDTPSSIRQEDYGLFIADEGLWVTGGITGGGIVYDWLIRTHFQNLEGLLPGQIYQHVDALVQTVGPGADGLLFIPYLGGQQSPDWDAKQRGAFIGLGVEHGVAHFARAALEGLAFSLYRIANAVSSNSLLSVDRIYMSGGITHSEVWLQLAADVFGCEVVAPESTEGSARGSTLLALLALGIITRPEELSVPDTEYKIFAANESNHKAYQDIFMHFENTLKRLYD
ncbi:MAG: gluconokinase [Anaerolineales bacterium]|nr:gluconokinase [Anaerolineales bacterium]